MAKTDPHVALLAARLAARLEFECSMGVTHVRVRHAACGAPVTGVAREPVTDAAADNEMRPPAAACPPPAGFSGDDIRQAMDSLRAMALDCTACILHRDRRNVVFGEGALDTDLVFVGEAPGQDEDMQGRPFVGAAGQLLTRIIEGGLGRPRSSVYICNILKCHPPRNRDPLPDEVHACTPFLARQLGIIKPRVIVALGRVAGNFLTGQQITMGRLRGCWWEYEGIPLRAIYHPAYLLRERRRSGRGNPADRKTLEDLHTIKDRLRGQEKS